jgi:predicted nucleotidyltransferase
MKTKPKKRTGKLDPAILADIVKRIVRAAKPEKIVLFGSAARGTMGPDSDYDLLVIKGGKYNHWRMLTTIYRGLRGKGAPVDVVLVTPEQVERYRDVFCLVIYPALREGIVVYDSETPTAGQSARMARSSAKQSGARKVARPRIVS